jgi:hypothetical protein
VVGAIGSTLGAPASVLAFSPVGFAIVGVGAIGWLAYDNRESIISVGQEAWDWLTGEDPEANQDSDYSANRGDGSSPLATLTYKVEAGSTPSHVTTTRICLLTARGQLFLPEDNLCGPAYNTQGGLGYRAVCQHNTTGAFRVDGAGSQNGNPGNDNDPTAGHTPWANGDTPRDSMVCKADESVRRVVWYNRTDDPSWMVKQGTTTFGGAPIEQRMDRTCALIADPRPLNNVTATGDTRSDGTIHSPECPEGYTPIANRIHTRVVGDTDWNSVDGADAGLAADQALFDKYAECSTYVGNQWVPTGNCAVAVWIDGAVCAVGVGYCWDWQAVDQATTRQVECRWGTTVLLPLEDCAPLAEAYRTGHYANDGSGGGWYSSNPDGSPSPYVGNDPSTNPYNPPNPNPGGGTGTNPGGTPNESGGADPDGDGENCWAAAISWNPVDWVVTPIKCALIWAFVPDAGYMGLQLGTIAKTWDGTIVGRWFGSVGDAADQLSAGPAGGGCQGPGLTVSTQLVGGGDQTMHPFSTCAQPMSTVAAIVRAALTVGLWLGVCFLGVRFVAAAVGLQLGEWGKDRDSAAV